MNPETFFDNFGMLADVPNGVSKLRGLILQLAVQGKLVAQDENDEPASMLFGKIKAEKERLVKEGIIRKQKPLHPVEINEAPHELPDNWLWERLVHLFYPVSTSNKKIKTSEIEEHGIYPVIDQGQMFVRGYTNEADMVIEILGPVIVFGDHTCEIKYVDFDFVAGADGVKILRPIGVHERFFYLVLRNTKLEGRGYSRHYKYLLNNLFPLPPFEEQKRIVTKVDQLMALCDELEARQQKKQEARMRLNSAALDKLLTAHEPAEFANHWQRVCDNFDLLYDNPETVGELRKAILQLAVQGRLVRQDANDEPAAVLLEKIKVEKEILVKEGKLKKSKPLPTTNMDDIPFHIPDNWEWTMLGNLCYKVADGPHFSPKYVTKEEGVPFLSARNIKINGFELDSVKYVSIEDHIEFCKRVTPKKCDVLYTKGGTTGVALVNDLEFDFSIWVHLAILQIAKNYVNSYYLSYTLNSPLCYEQSQAFTHGSSNRDLGLTRMVKIMLPLPPKNEQRRIVIKVDQLMALCDELEAKLRQSQTDGAKLMEAVVHKLVAA